MPNFDGQEVGRISIKVTPNLDGFRRELRRELEEIEKSERGQVTVDVDADTSGVREKIEAAARDTTANVDVDVDNKSLDRFQRRMLREIEAAMAKIEPKLHLTADGEALRRSLEKEAFKLSRQAHFEVDADLDIAAGQREALAAKVKAAKEFAEKAAGPLEFKLHTDKEQFAADRRIAQFRAQRAKELEAQRIRSANLVDQIETRHANTRHRNEMRMLKEQLNASIQGFKDQEVAVQANLDEMSFEKVLAEAKALASRAGVSLDVDIKDEAAEAKLAETITKLKIEAAAANIKIHVDVDHDQVRRSLGEIGRGVGQSLKKSMGSITRVLSDDVTLIAALLVGFLAPALALLSGFIAGLPALMAGFGVPLVAIVLGLDGIKKAAEVLKPALDSLKSVMSKKFEDVFTPIFTGLKPLFGMAEVALPPVVDALGTLAKTVSDTLMSSSGMKALSGTIEGVTTSLNRAAPGLHNFVDGFLNLAARGADSLPILSDMFNHFGDEFSAWVTKITTRGPDGVSTLDSVLSNLRGPVQALLDEIGGLIARGVELMADPEFASKMTTFIHQVGDFVQMFVTISEKLFNGLVYLTTGVGAVVDFISKVVSSIGQLAAAPLQLIGVWDQITQGAGAAFEGLRTIVTSAMSAAVQAVTSKAAEIMSEVGSWPGKIKAALGSLAGILVAAGKAAMDGLLSGLKSGFEAVKGFVSGIAGWIKEHKGPLPYDRTVLIENGKALMQGLGTGIEQGFQGVLEQAQSLAARIGEAMENGTLNTDLGGFKQQYQRQMDAIKLERQQLQLQLSATTDKGQRKALQDQLKQLSTVQQTLSMQSQQLKLTDKYGGSLAGTNETMGQMLSKMTQMGQQFAQANAKQAMSDLGISGDGAVSKLADIGVGYLGNMLSKLVSSGAKGGTTIQVNSVDEALAARQNIANKQALRYDRR